MDNAGFDFHSLSITDGSRLSRDCILPTSTDTHQLNCQASAATRFRSGGKSSIPLELRIEYDRIGVACFVGDGTELKDLSVTARHAWPTIGQRQYLPRRSGHHKGHARA